MRSTLWIGRALEELRLPVRAQSVDDLVEVAADDRVDVVERQADPV